MLAYVSSIILSVISGVLVYLVQGLIRENRTLQKEKKQDVEQREKALCDGVLSLLRIQLIEYHDKYMTKNTIPLYIFENWDEMYKAYNALGGNGTVRRMNDDINMIRVGGDRNEIN